MSNSQKQLCNLNTLLQVAIQSDTIKTQGDEKHGFSPYPFQHYLAFYVIGLILNIAKQSKEGDQWIERHILAISTHSEPDPYFRSKWSNAHELNLHISRTVQLGELLYNLQTVTGITPIFNRLVDDIAPGQIESTILELVGLSLIWQAHLPFSITHPPQAKGKKYECRVTLPNQKTVFCEMKCKVESTAYSQNTVKKTISGALSQLPPSQCGVAILKIPDGWMQDQQILRSL